MNRAMEEERSNTTKNVIQEARQYIQENFRDPDLSVEKICRHLHMSPAYFSTVFKKETGQAYIAYLTDVRLNRAVELLMTTEDKTYIMQKRLDTRSRIISVMSLKRNSGYLRQNSGEPDKWKKRIITRGGRFF